MRFKKLAWLALSITAAAALTACNIGATPAPTLDVEAIYTQAAQTAFAGFAAQMTQTAQAMPPTAMPSNTPLATFTLLPTFPPLTGGSPVPGTTPGLLATPITLATPGATLVVDSCNNSGFGGDISIPDGTVLKPGQDFVKTWALQNLGTCKWAAGYTFVFVAGDKMDGYDIRFQSGAGDKKMIWPVVNPGETVEIDIEMTAHVAEGDYTGCWRMKDDKGYYFGTLACYAITVKK